MAKNIFDKKITDERVVTFIIPSSDIEKSNFTILDAMEKLNLSKSRSDTKRLIKSNGIKINDITYSSNVLSLKDYSNETEIKLSVGKKNIGVLKISH